MEANELMIRDWVMFKESKYPYQVLTTSYMNVVLPSTGGDLTSDIEPIPLTEEILKANGFEDMDGYFRLMASSNVYARQGEGFDKGYFGISIQIPSGLLVFDRILCYVHELQHALRLCGLNELADTFKLERQGVEENAPVAEGGLKILDLCEDGSIKYEYRLNEYQGQDSDGDLNVGDYVFCEPSNMLTKMGTTPRFDGRIVAVHSASYSVKCYAGGKKLIVLELRKSDVFKADLLWP